jgi:hypothetical protein
MFWVAGDSRKKTEDDMAKEDATRTADGLVPYGYYRNRRA